MFAVTILGTSLPAPLYAIYQRQWHFSSGIVTLIFAAYAVAVLAVLLVAGRTSDQVGRKPVMATALGFSALSTVVFILASGLGWLYLGRILSGLSAGLMTGAAAARLNQKIARQLHTPTSAPPRTGPTASASPDTAAHTPIARDRLRTWG